MCIRDRYSELAQKTQNHFGLKCFSKTCKSGHCANFKDDHHKDFFRIFKKPEDSFLFHSEFLKAKRYKPCFAQKTPEGWAEQLQKCGYATDKKYAKKLTDTIKKFNLKQYDPKPKRFWEFW
jgi:flagellum-specific peptidoglycan hydrolase FlgJ